MKITLRQLEVFVAIAQQGNLTQAATHLFLTQSATSMALAQLETQLKTLLFERLGKRLSLNDQGKALLPKAVEVISRIYEIEQSIKSTDKNLHGELSIGASTTIGNYLMPALIGRFCNEYDNVQVKLHINNTDNIIKELLNFNIDIGFIEGYCHHPNIKLEKYWEDELIIISASKYALAKKKQIALNDLNQAKWVLREKGSGTREVFEKAIYNKLHNLNIALELGSTEAIKQAVLTGIGISCVSKLSVMKELQAKELIQLPVKLSIKRNLYRLIHQNKYYTRCLEIFLQHSKHFIAICK